MSGRATPTRSRGRSARCSPSRARAAFLASEALAEVWRLTDRRLLGPGGRAIPLAQIKAARPRPWLGADHHHGGDRHLIKYHADPAATAVRIMPRR